MYYSYFLITSSAKVSVNYVLSLVLRSRSSWEVGDYSKYPFFQKYTGHVVISSFTLILCDYLLICRPEQSRGMDSYSNWSTIFWDSSAGFEYIHMLIQGGRSETLRKFSNNLCGSSLYSGLCGGEDRVTLPLWFPGPVRACRRDSEQLRVQKSKAWLV